MFQRWLALVLLVVLAVAKNPEERVVEWIVENGGQVDFVIGKDCPDCVRGALATKPFEEGDLIAKLPFNVTVAFEPESYSAQGRALELLERMHTEPTFNQTFQPWWDSQPSPGKVLCAELLSEEHLKMLQSPWLELHAAGMRSMGEDFFEGRLGKMGRPLNEVIAPAHVSFSTFLYVTALITTRSFSFSFTVDGQQVTREFMLPAIDQLNHPFDGRPNAWRTNDANWVYEYAQMPIKQGEQITHVYHPGQTHRPDMSFAVYGFVMKNDPPVLCAQDLPDFSAQDPFRDTPQTDNEDDPQGADALRQEVQRLKKILEQLPTSLEEDQLLLQKEQDWKVLTILELRVERKRALHYRMNRLQQSLSEL